MQAKSCAHMNIFVDTYAHVCTLLFMPKALGEQTRTYLAEHKARHGSTVVWLAKELKTKSRPHVYHLLDPTNPKYAKYAINDELMANYAALVERSQEDVIANYHQARGAR